LTKPEEDPYKGSMITWKPDLANLKKIIVQKDFLTRHEACQFERELIESFIDHPLNRNYSIPGNNKPSLWGAHLSSEHKQKLSKIFKGKSFSQRFGAERATEIGKKISIALKGRKSPTSSFPKGMSVRKIWEEKYGKERAEELWQKKYENLRGKPSWNTNNRKICQYDAKNNFIAEYDGLQDILDKNPSFTKSNICRAIKHGTFSSGFKWKYSEKFEKVKFPGLNNIPTNHD
jgi:hypothetical protein